MSERPRNEKEEKEEKGGEESWEEKWRRDPLTAAGWAIVLIWAGLVLLAENMGILDNLRVGLEAWSVIFIGAGVIVLLGVLIRLLVPAYRRPVGGSIVFGFILLGIGLGEVVGWVAIGPLILIAIGVSIILTRLIRGA
jgi:hypothetical protein